MSDLAKPIDAYSRLDVDAMTSVLSSGIESGRSGLGSAVVRVVARFRAMLDCAIEDGSEGTGSGSCRY